MRITEPVTSVTYHNEVECVSRDASPPEAPALPPRRTALTTEPFTESQSAPITSEVPPSGHRAPLFEAMRDYAKKDMAAFHTPGHKQGQGMDPEFRAVVGDNMLRMDLCELPEVDNL